MAGIASIVGLGFGFGSTVGDVVTLGFGIGVGYTPIVHYHELEGPSNEQYVIEGPPAKRITLEGTSKVFRQLLGAG